MNLPYSAESTETDTAGDTVSVVLRERLNSSTVYYYTVSAVHGDVTVVVSGTFTTPQYSKQWGKCVLHIRSLITVGIHNGIYRVSCFHLDDHYTGCFLTELWDLPAADAIYLTDVDASAAQYPSCGDGSVGSVALMNTTLNIATVAYYTGTTPGSRACFVCDESSGYELSTTTIAERFCQHNGLWSGSPTVCGMS